MGDLRNKAAKQEREEARHRYMAQRYPKDPPPPPIHCQCGLDPAEVSAMWAVPGLDRWSPAVFYCSACIRPICIAFLPSVHVHFSAPREWICLGDSCR